MSNVVVPTELTDATHEQVTEWVTKQNATALAKLVPIAQKNPTEYTEKVAAVMAEGIKRVEDLMKAIKENAKDAKAEAEKAELAAQADVMEFRKTLSTQFAEFFRPHREAFEKLPSTLSAFLVVAHVENQPAQITVSIAKKLAQSASKADGTGGRGRKAKYGVKITVDGAVKEYDSIADGRVVFLKEKERQQNYSKKTFEARCLEYGYSVEFVEKS